MLVDLTCREFVEELASDAAAPGGGSVAALAGSLAAGLVEMVCRLSVGKELLKFHESEFIQAMERAGRLREQLLGYVDLDTEAFNQVMAAYKLPRGSEEQKAARLEAIQQAVKQAAQIPLQVAECCREVLELCKGTADKGNSNALSDVKVAAVMAFAGMQGALFNVEINLTAVKDQKFVAEMKEKSVALSERGACNVTKLALSREVFPPAVDLKTSLPV